MNNSLGVDLSRDDKLSTARGSVSHINNPEYCLPAERAASMKCGILQSENIDVFV